MQPLLVVQSVLDTVNGALEEGVQLNYAEATPFLETHFVSRSTCRRVTMRRSTYPIYYVSSRNPKGKDGSHLTPIFFLFFFLWNKIIPRQFKFKLVLLYY
jgi:hypothetical protein